MHLDSFLRIGGRTGEGPSAGPGRPGRFNAGVAPPLKPSTVQSNNLRERHESQRFIETQPQTAATYHRPRCTLVYAGERRMLPLRPYGGYDVLCFEMFFIRGRHRRRGENNLDESSRRLRTGGCGAPVPGCGFQIPISKRR